MANRRIWKKAVASASLGLLLGFPCLAQHCQPESGAPVGVPGDPKAIQRLFRLDENRPDDCFFLELHTVLLSGADPKNDWSSNDREKLKRLITGGQLGTVGRAPVPLPFGLDNWQAALGDPELTAANAFEYFVNNPDASRLLVALHALDPITRERVRRTFQREERGKIKETGWNILYRKALDGFYRFPQALVLRADGNFDLPGGMEAEPVWRSLFGVSPADREAFLTTLFQKDNGKAAYLVKTLQQLPGRVAEKLILGNSGQGKEAAERFQRFYGAIKESGTSLSQPRRDPYDFAHVVQFVSLSQRDGLQLLGEVGPALVALDSNQSGSSDSGGNAVEGRIAADEALGQLLREEPAARRRVLFVSSILEARPRLRDRDLMAQMLRGADRFHSMYAVLEDLPLDPALARRYVATLEGLDHRKASPDAEVTAGLFEAGVVLLAHLSRSGGLEPAEAGRLFGEFIELGVFSKEGATFDNGEPEFFRWLSNLLRTLRSAERRVIDEKTRERDEQQAAYRALLKLHEDSREAPLIDEAGGQLQDKSQHPDSGQQEQPPRWVEIPKESESPDDLLAHALAGPATTADFGWGRERYRVNVTSEVAKGVPPFRTHQSARTEEHRPTRLSDLQELHVKREALTAAVESGNLVAVASAARDLESGLLPEAAARGKVGNEGSQQRHLRAYLVLKRLQAASTSKGPVVAREQLVYLDEVIADRDLEALLVHVYMAAGAESHDFDLVHNHPFLSVSPTRRATLILGSLFSLGDKLSLLHENSISDASVPDEVISGLAAPIRMMSRGRLDDDALQVVRYSCEATEEFAAGIAGKSEWERLSLWTDLARDLVSRSRLGLVSADPASLKEHLSPSDLYRIGRRLATGPTPGNLPSAVAARDALQRLTARLGDKVREALAEFGPRASSYAGSLRLRDMDMPPYEWTAEYRGQQGLQIFSDRLYDLKIAVARRVAEAGLPAAVLPVVLPAALDDMIRNLKMAFSCDWLPIVRAAQDFKQDDLRRILQDAIGARQLTRVETTDALEKKTTQ